MNHRKKTGKTLPYAQQLTLRKQAELIVQRNDAAQTALLLACLAMNDEFGIGKERILRFSARLEEYLKQYYEDREMGDEVFYKRFKALGFDVEREHGRVEVSTLREENNYGNL